MPAGDVREKPLGGRLKHVEYALEPALTAVVGIRHLTHWKIGRKVEEELELPLQPIGTELGQTLVVILIHRQDIVEAMEVLSECAPRAQIADVDPALASRLARPPIRRLAQMIGMRPSRIDLDEMRQTGIHHQFPEYAMGGRRTADIAHANEENLDLRFVTHGRICSQNWRL